MIYIKSGEIGEGCGGRERGWKSVNILVLIGLSERTELSEDANLRYECNIRMGLKRA
jgi:hypothetical protein